VCFPCQEEERKESRERGEMMRDLLLEQAARQRGWRVWEEDEKCILSYSLVLLVRQLSHPASSL
jgi:hypothetical protein